MGRWTLVAIMIIIIMVHSFSPSSVRIWYNKTDANARSQADLFFCPGCFLFCRNCCRTNLFFEKGISNRKWSS